MSETVVDPGQLSERDKEALAAAGGMGLNTGLGQPRQAVTPTPNTSPTGGKDIKPDPQPGPGAAPAADPNAVKPVLAGTGADSIKVDSPLGAKVFGQPGGEVVLSSFEDVQAYAKDKGVELESVDSIKGLITQVQSLSKQAQEIATLNSLVSQYKSQIGSLPPEVANIVDAAINGQEYRSIIKDIAAGASLDLSRKFDEHNTLTMIRQYVQPSITQEAFDELTDANRNALTAVARTKYDTDKVKWQQATADKSAAKEVYTQSYNKSINTAMANLKQAFPTMGDDALKVVYDKMTYGLKDSLFNTDNTYKPDAGVKIAMQEFGQATLKESYDTIGKLAQQMESRIQGQTHEQLLKRNDQPDQSGRQVVDQTNVVSEAVKSQTSFLKAR